MNKYLVRNFKWIENLGKVPAKVYRLAIFKLRKLSNRVNAFYKCDAQFVDQQIALHNLLTEQIYKYSKTSLNRTLLFQKVVWLCKISVYTKCRIAPANRTKLGLWGGFSDVSARKPG